MRLVELARSEHGGLRIRADQVAETLGKSVSTAYNLLASLCDEGVAERQLRGAVVERDSEQRVDRIGARLLTDSGLPILRDLKLDLLPTVFQPFIVGNRTGKLREYYRCSGTDGSGCSL